MTDENTPADGDDAASNDLLSPEDLQVASQAENPDAVKRALAANRQQLKDAERQAAELAAKVREFEDRDRSEIERAQARIEELEQAASAAQQQVADLQAAQMRSRVASEIGLPAALADRLRGDDEDQVRQDAEQLMAAVGASRPAPTPFGAGPRGSTGSANGTHDMNDLIRHAAGRR